MSEINSFRVLFASVALSCSFLRCLSAEAPEERQSELHGLARPILSLNPPVGNTTSNDKDLRALAGNPFHFRRELYANGVRIDVELAVDVFYQKKHSVSRKDGVVLIDGLRPIGAEHEGEIAREFQQFSIRWGQEDVRLPKTAYADLYNAALSAKLWPNDPKGSVWVTVSSDAQAILIEFSGGDAGAGYKATLVIRRDGNYFRFVDNAVP